VSLEALGEVNVCGNRFTDLWLNEGPATALAPHLHKPEVYEEAYFTNHTLAAIAAHDLSTPLFLFHSFHLIHTPLEVPTDYLDQFSFVDYKNRQLYAAMVYYCDTVIGQITAAIQARPGMWDNTLVVMLSDNGGPVYRPASANNYPHRGGKYSCVAADR